MAGTFETWLEGIRLAWNGDKFRAIWGALGRAVGDANLTRAQQALAEHLPSFATDAQSVALTASERQIDGDPAHGELLAGLLPTWLQSWTRAGTMGGMLLAMDGAGFHNAVLVQQNGLGFSLHDPSEFLSAGSIRYDFPERSDFVLWVTTLATNASVHLDNGSASPWWTFPTEIDTNGDYFESQVAVLFPGGGTLSSAEQDRLRSILVKWKPAKVTVANIYVLISGRFLGWPTTNQVGDGSSIGGSVTIYTGV